MRAMGRWCFAFIAWCWLVGVARAEIVVGVSLSLTGPAAVIGQAQREVVGHLPRRIASEAVRYEVRDDGSDPARAAANAEALVTQAGADAVIGSTSVAGTLAMLPVLASRRVVLITPALAYAQDAASARGLFRTVPDTRVMANAVFAHMQAQGVRRAAFMGADNGFAFEWGRWFETLALVRHIERVAVESADAGSDALAASSARVVAQHPDAVLIAATGTRAVAAVVALRRGGYGGRIYLTHAAAVEPFPASCPVECDGVLLPASPGRVADPVREDPAAVRPLADALGGRGFSVFEAGVWDAAQLLAAAIPAALARGAAGSPAFRAGLRDAIERLPATPGANGVYRFSRTDHSGLDQRAAVMLRVAGGAWTLAE